jgi:tetratricopeptide (TPR) repeat protein
LARGDREAALDWAGQAVAIVEKNELKQQSGPLRALGAALAAADRYREGDEALRRAVALDRAGDGEDGLATARTLAQLGNALLRQKRFAEALPPIEEAARIDQSRLGSTHPRIVDDFYGIGIAQLETARPAAAAKILRYALGLADRSAAKDAPSAAYLRLALARAEHRLGRADQARSLFAEAQRILAAAVDDERQRERRT